MASSRPSSCAWSSTPSTSMGHARHARASRAASTESETQSETRQLGLARRMASERWRSLEMKIHGAGIRTAQPLRRQSEKRKDFAA